MRDNRKCLTLQWFWLLAGPAVALTTAPLAAQTPPPPTRHAERLTFDEKTGQWLRTPEPIPGTENGDLDIARQYLAREEYETALEVIKAWLKQYGSTSTRYPEGLYVQGTAYLGTGEYRAAHETYQKLLNDYPGSEYAERALKGEFTIAEQYLAGKRRKAFFGLFRVKDREGGVKIMDDMVANYADTPLAEMAQMSKADYYYARNEFELAQDEYVAFANAYPRSRWHPRALLQSARSALSSFPGVKFDDAALVEAEERFNQFRKAYPESANQNGVDVILEEVAGKRAQKTYEIARFYDKTRKWGAAVYYYRATVRNWPGTPAAAQAEQRLTVLGQPVVAPPPAPEQAARPSGAAGAG